MAARAATVSDPGLGYAITLPAGWAQFKTKPAQHYFRDTTGKYRSQISIVKYDIDKGSYPTPENWTQAQFIAYKMSVETSVYPFGAVAYYDSSAAAKIGPLWAPEAYSMLFPGDGDPTYCEFIRYCAKGNVGYEIYAIGDSADMTANVDYLAGIIATMEFSTPVGLAHPGKAPGRAGRESGFDAETFDLSGRKMPRYGERHRDPGPARGSLIFPSPK